MIFRLIITPGNRSRKFAGERSYTDVYSSIAPKSVISKTNLNEGLDKAANPLTPPARLAAVGKRVDSMLQAVKMVSAALNNFYGTLSDEQKARFEAIGPQRTSQLETLEVAPTEAPPAQVPRYRRGIPGPEEIIRRLLSPFKSLQVRRKIRATQRNVHAV